MEKNIKVHIGCGERYLEGWIHIDRNPYLHVDYITDAKNLSDIFDDESVDVIYACHVLEHFKRNEIDIVLAEWYRILKSSGTLRLAVPDFESLCRIYDKYKDMELIMGPLHGRGHNFSIHYISFDERYLKKRLELAGFRNVRRWNWREVDHGYVDDMSQCYIPHMDKENGIPISLNMECIK